MKTQIIHLEPHDDLASVLDKLKRTKAERLILIWPGRNRILTERLDLRLVQRNAAKRGALLGFVTLDPDVQAHARALGIHVFEDLNNLHLEPWPETDPLESLSTERHDRSAQLDQLRSQMESKTLRQVPRAVGWSLFSLVLITFVSLVFLLIPTATIEIDPLREEIQRSLTIPVLTADDDAGEILRVDRVRLEGSVRIPTSGVSSEPGEYARGIAEFTNLSDERITVPAGTTIRESGSSQLYFITRSSIVLSAEEGANRTVDILASQPGAGGNRPADRITAVDGELGLRVAVVNPEATSGGSVTSRNAVASADRDRARDQLTAELRSRARELMLANPLPEEQLLEDSLTIEEVLSETFDRSIGETADTVELEMSVIVRARVANLTELENRVLADLSALQEPEKRLVPQSLTMEVVSLNESQALSQMDLVLDVSYQLYEEVDKNAILRAANGMQPLMAQRQITDRFPGNNFSIDLKPDWYPLLPLFQPQIHAVYTWEPQS